MRQGQQNKRQRGRNRKPQNSANRSYESNGPDVKIRGNASHVAEKYVALARKYDPWAVEAVGLHLATLIGRKALTVAIRLRRRIRQILAK